MNLKTLGWLVLAVVAALTFRNAFPKRITTPGVPRIVTQYDTVPSEKIDTLWRWRNKLVRDARAEYERDSLRTLLERSTTTVPETVFVVTDLDGVTALTVGEQVGDSTLVAGFSLARLDTGYAFRRWQAQFYTPGPLKSIVLDGSVPRVTFYPPPPPPCRFSCKAKIAVVSAAFGFGVAAVLK